MLDFEDGKTFHEGIKTYFPHASVAVPNFFAFPPESGFQVPLQQLASSINQLPGGILLFGRNDRIEY